MTTIKSKAGCIVHNVDAYKIHILGMFDNLSDAQEFVRSKIMKLIRADINWRDRLGEEDDDRSTDDESITAEDDLDYKTTPEYQKYLSLMSQKLEKAMKMYNSKTSKVHRRYEFEWGVNCYMFTVIL